MGYKDPDKQREYQRAWAAEQRKREPEKVKEANKRWRIANPEKVAATKRKWRSKNKESVKAAKRRYVEAHRDQALARKRKYMEKVRYGEFHEIIPVLRELKQTVEREKNVENQNEFYVQRAEEHSVGHVEQGALAEAKPGSWKLRRRKLA